MIDNTGDWPRIAVLGGNGFFGRLISRDLLEHTRVSILIAGRHPPSAATIDPRLSFVRVDLRDLTALKYAFHGVFAVIHCAGPYEDADALNPLQAAIALGAHYIDLAEGRDFCRQVHEYGQAARAANIAVLSGMSVIPGLAALLVQVLRPNFETIDSIRTFVAPGTRGSRGPATVYSLLAGVGRPICIRRGQRELSVRGWSEGERIDFPPPVGRRRLYLALESGDFDLFPQYFGAEGIEFKGGSEFAWLNRALAVIAGLRARAGFPRIERWTNLLRRVLWVIGHFGTDRGGVLVEIIGAKKGKLLEQRIAVTADQQGERIPAIPAAIAAGALLEGAVQERGIVPLHRWLSTAALLEELSKRDLRLWLKSSAGAHWQARGNPEE